ncbi:hypothetical protein SCUCBS95973_008898 [Sporothrix curviconia]|uniref:Uncharacterized protein n=1 Tax=Sporothrix curviconia TaxID=1260050 RepID=A0ABP0CQI7_9PEZI
MAFVDLPDRDRDALFDPLLEGKVDYLLAHDVPVKRAAAAAAAANPAKDDSLTPWTDFPLLGERLLKLQQYNRDQQPTSTRGMLRDHRNPAQWYTLWAVLIMGFISLVLSAAQLGVGIAQLKAA